MRGGGVAFEAGREPREAGVFSTAAGRLKKDAPTMPRTHPPSPPVISAKIAPPMTVPSGSLGLKRCAMS